MIDKTRADTMYKFEIWVNFNDSSPREITYYQEQFATLFNEHVSYDPHQKIK